MIKGFTLIELLVVISIIGLLASVVLSSLQSARESARVSALKVEARQLFNNAQQHYLKTESYSGFYVNDTYIDGSRSSHCGNQLNNSSEFFNNSQAICNRILERNAPLGFYIGCDSSGGNCQSGQDFSIMINLDGQRTPTVYCIGSSGAVFEGTYNISTPGCYGNP